MNHLLESAYTTCKLRAKDKAVRFDDFHAELAYAYWNYRDLMIDRWATGLVDESADELDTFLLDEVYSTLDLHGLYWEYPCWEPSDLDDATSLVSAQKDFIAWGIACLWWKIHEGSVWMPIHERDDLVVWLAKQNETDRLSRLTSGRDGTVVKQAIMF